MTDATSESVHGVTDQHTQCSGFMDVDAEAQPPAYSDCDSNICMDSASSMADVTMADSDETWRSTVGSAADLADLAELEAVPLAHVRLRVNDNRDGVRVNLGPLRDVALYSGHWRWREVASAEGKRRLASNAGDASAMEGQGETACN